MIRIRGMTADDVDLGMRLKEQAHWNQTPVDWRWFLAMQPEGCFAAEHAGVAAGTAVVCLFDSVAWIAMVLVEASLRGRGIGKALLQRALDFVDERRVPSVRLDATALGQPLYERLGFAPQYSLDRYAGRISSVEPSSLAGFRPARNEDYPPMIELDRSATDCDRRRFLLHLFQEQPEQTYVLQREERTIGFSTVRTGSGAWQLGPCIAEPQAGIDVVRHAMGRLSGEQVLLDVPVDNHQAAQLAQAAGLQVERRFLRMCRGPAIHDDLQRLWASSGPELG